jgi:predicted transglutaminase-like cysteine proteinase
MPLSVRRHCPNLRLKALACIALGGLLLSPVTLAKSPIPSTTALADTQSAARLLSWESLLQNAVHGDEQALLKQVNGFINRSVRFVSDQQAWGVEDYWATPMETLTQGMGDCEDFAIAKYFSLVRMGVPSEKLRLTFVKALKQNQAHMVLAYYASPDAQPLILDNLDAQIRPASELSDLLPVYAFNDLGVFLAKAPQRISQPPQFLSRWSELSERAMADGSAPSAPQS